MEERIPEPRRNKNASILANLEEYEVDVSRGIEPRSEGKMSLGGGEDTGKLQCHGTDKPSFRRPFN